MNANSIPATIGKALEVLSWREEQIEVLKETIERMDGEMTQKDKHIAELESALLKLEKWSNAHLGWSVSLAGHVDGVYEEIAKVGKIARKAMEGKP